VATPTAVDVLDHMNPDVLALAEAVSPAVRIEPQLLRKMRLDILPAANAGTEADLWFSEMVETRTPAGIVLRVPAVQLLRERLRRKPAILESAWRVIESLHRTIAPPIFTEERLTYLALAGRDEEWRALLRSAVATLLSPGRRGLASWAVRAFERLPTDVRLSEEAQMLVFGASLRLGDAAVIRDEVGGVLPDWAGWLSPSEMETVPLASRCWRTGSSLGPRAARDRIVSSSPKRPRSSSNWPGTTRAVVNSNGPSSNPML
jgi:hypothetical protein